MLRTLAMINTLLLAWLLWRSRGTASTLKRLTKMATKDDVTRLESALENVKSAAESVAADTSALKEEIKKKNENDAVDLSKALTMATDIETRLKAIAGSAVGSDPEDNGGETGGGIEG